MEKEKDVTFIVHKDWLNNIATLNVELQDKVIADFIRYGVELDLKHEDEPVVVSLVNFTKDRIDYSKDKYAQKIENGKNGGRKKKVDNQEIWKLAREGKRSEEIANLLGISKSSVDHSDGWKQRDKDQPFFF